MVVSLALALKTLLCLLGCFMIATHVFITYYFGSPLRPEVFTPWMTATAVDFIINALVVWTWAFYKESNWIVGIILLPLIVFIGSMFTCFYIVLQFLKLTPRESLQDPIYFVLLHREKNENEVQQRLKLSVTTAKVLYAALGCLMLGTLLYTLFTYGSPFRKGVLIPWLVDSLVDFYIQVFILSVWVVYKESRWIIAIGWIVLLICFGSISTCAYIVLQLFHLSADDPVSAILFNRTRRTENQYEQKLQGEY